MCGIAGVVNRRAGLPPPSREVLASMAGALAHRGPDEFGLYRDNDAGLSHARLSIIDLATGQQPLTNERQTLWISFNGEIFNYLELRDELVASGHTFRTRSDTEVIVHAYEQWGEDAFRRMNGQWAVALWDAAQRSLILARDPLGVRPLYVCEHDGRLYFASEVKAIFAADAAVPRRLDPAGLDQVFTLWSTVSPRTVFEGIEQVEPGTVRVYEQHHERRARSWEPAYPARRSCRRVCGKTTSCAFTTSGNARQPPFPARPRVSESILPAAEFRTTPVWAIRPDDDDSRIAE